MCRFAEHKYMLWPVKQYKLRMSTSREFLWSFGQMEVTIVTSAFHAETESHNNIHGVLLSMFLTAL